MIKYEVACWASCVYGGVVGTIDTAFVIAGVHYNITVHTTPRACATPTDQDLFLTAPISQGKKGLNFQISTKLQEPKKFKGWVLEN